MAIIFDWNKGLIDDQTGQPASWDEYNAGLDYDPMTGQPRMPAYKSLLDPSTGMLSAQYQLSSENALPAIESKLAGIQLNKEGLDAFRNRALGEIDPATGKRVVGPSAWAKLATQQADMEQQTARDKGAAQALAGAAQARAQLAMRGGLSGGASERLARQGGLDLMRMNQEAGRAGAANRLNVSLQDETQRLSALSQLPGMEVQALQPELQKTQMWGQAQQFDIGNRSTTNQFNIQQALADKRAQDQYEATKYQERMKAWAADKQATAEQNSGK